MSATLKTSAAGTLEIACQEARPPDGPGPLMHGFPCDPRAFGGVVERSALAGIHTIAPYPCGYGAARCQSSRRRVRARGLRSAPASWR